MAEYLVYFLRRSQLAAHHLQRWLCLLNRDATEIWLLGSPSSAARQDGGDGGRARVLLRRAGWTVVGCADFTNRFFSSLCSLLLLDMQAPIWMVETFYVQSGQCLRLSDMAALGFRASTTKRTGSFLRRYRPGITVGIFDYGRGDWGG